MEASASASPQPPQERLPVTMIGSLPPWKGVSPYTQQLVEALAAGGAVDLEFIGFRSLYPQGLYPGGEPRDAYAACPLIPGVVVREVLQWWNPLSWLRAGLSLRGRVVHAQWWSYVLAPVYLAVLAVARLRGRRIVVTVHNAEPHEGGVWRRLLNAAVVGLGHRVIVHSQRNAATLLRERPRLRERLAIVPHGVPARTARRRQARRSASDGLPAGRRVVLFFGNIRPYKGLDWLLLAMPSVVRRCPEALLVVAGRPWTDWAPYASRIRSLGLEGHVLTFLDYLPEERLEGLLAAADLAVFPYTHFHAQSGAAALALSLGLPLIVTDVGALPELVDDPRAVVPPEDAEALAEAIVRVLDDDALRRKLAGDSRRRARELDWAGIARRTVGVYRELAA